MSELRKEGMSSYASPLEQKLQEKKETTASAPDVPLRKEGKMPDLPKGPACFYDTANLTFWVGVPLDRVDPITGLVSLDRFKMEMLGFYNQAAIEVQKRKTMVTPTWGISGIFNKINNKFRR